MKAVALLLLGGLGLAAQAHAQEPSSSTPQVAVAADTSFSRQSQPSAPQLPDVNEQESDVAAPSFVNEPQNQAMMLVGLLAAGFLVRRRRDD
ncbi:hypothetical protein [Roseateles chitosanitabidus]|jgi:MYXO-CTERM domain-containing protein|uniref:hypothetical protein n=1 Tax=Roseateles chitosanitabidus TaxID=65048 RepID=UPI0011DF3F32|nr:hypothetical protein [Roseateles chitosanitabidus]MBO9687002.1 hypothetical protein [Roseateles chitosanitabidus]